VQLLRRPQRHEERLAPADDVVGDLAQACGCTLALLDRGAASSSAIDPGGRRFSAASDRDAYVVPVAARRMAAPWTRSRRRIRLRQAAEPISGSTPAWNTVKLNSNTVSFLRNLQRACLKERYAH